MSHDAATGFGAAAGGEECDGIAHEGVAFTPIVCKQPNGYFRGNVETPPASHHLPGEYRHPSDQFDWGLNSYLAKRPLSLPCSENTDVMLC